MKRFLSGIVALIMILAVVPAFAASADLEAFADSITAESITQNELSDFVTKDLVLPAAPAGVTVTWASSDESAITNDGKVTRADIEDKPVTMTATITDGTDTITKEINLNVVANATNVFYQNNFHYPELVGTSTVVTSAIGWTDGGSGKDTVEKSIRTDEDGNHYLYMDHASTAGYPQIGPSFSAKGSKITIRMDIMLDGTKGTSKIIDLWLGIGKGTSVVYSKPRMTTNANNITSLSGKLNLNAPPERTELYIELNMEDFTMRVKKGATGTWTSSWAMPHFDEGWNGELKSILFRRGSGGSPAAEIQVDNMIIYEERDRASYADSLDVDKTIAVLDASKMTADVNAVTEDLDLNYPELQAAIAANGTTVTFESSNPDVIAIADGKGIVNRGYEEQEVTLTATVSKGSYSDSTKKFKFTVPASQAATEIKNALAFSNMTNESNFAVTKDLNLSYNALLAIQSKYGAEVTMTSSNPAVLEIRDGKGYIARGEEEGTATLTISAVVDGVTFTREHNIVVPSINTYVFKSEDFNYPEAVGQNISEIGWACESDPDRFTTTIESESGEYYIDGFLPKSDGGTRRPSFTFQNDRDVKNISVEFTATYNEDTSVNAIYEFEFYGGTTGSDLDSTNTIARIQTNGRNMYICGHDGTNYYGKTLYTKQRGAIGTSDRYRFDFDFVNQGYDFYLDGVKQNTELMPFKSGITYDSFKKFNFAAFRQAVGSNILIDDFVIQARDVEFTSDYVSEAGQPLQVSVSYSETKYTDPVNITIVSEFDGENDLSQVFKIVNADHALTNNCHYDYHEAHLVNKESGAKSALVGYPTADESAPPYMNGTYLGANHGASEGVEVTATAHGKTNGDLGSVWVDNAGVQWTLIRVIDENTILFLSETERNETTGNWKFADTITGTTLTYDTSVSDNFAVNTDAITSLTVKTTSVQVFPSIGNRVLKMHVVRDGETTTYENMDLVREGFKISGSKVILEETYDVIDPTLIGESMRANRPDGGYTSMADISIGDPIMKYKQTITIYEDGDVIIDLDHEILKKVYSFQYYGYQYYKRADAFSGGLYRYMPGLKKYVSGDKEYDFSTPILMPISDVTNASSDLIPSSFIATSSYWANDIVPDRVIEYYKDTEGEYKMAFASGFVPIYDAAPDVRGENVTQTLYMLDRIGHKVYPMLANGDNYKAAGSKIRGVVFRHYDALDQSTKKVTAYDVEYKDDVYFYVDFLEDEDNFVLDLDAKTVTSDYELVYKTDDVTYSIEGNKLIASGKQSGYICVKGKRNAEIATVAYDNATHKLGVWLNNRSEEAVYGDVVIAGYKGGKFKSISVKKDVILSADDFTRLDIEDFNDNGVDEIKVFLVNMGTLTPLNYVKIIEAE